MKRILWGLLILVSLVVSGCGAGGKVNDPVTGTDNGAGATPSGAVFKYTVPNDDDTGIVTNSNIYIVFGQKMNDLTVNPSYFSVSCGGINEELSVDYDDTNMMATIWPSDGTLTGAAECTVTAKKGLRTAGSSNTIGSDYVFTFSTASGGGVTVPIDTPLAVDFTVPIDKATGVTVTEPFYMIFNKTLNPLTVTETSFSAACGSAAAKQPIANFVADYVTANNAVVVKPPAGGWPSGQICEIVARKDYVKDSANNPLKSNLTFTFSTGAGGGDVATALAVDYAIPVPPANQIAANTELTFVFNKALNENTVHPTAFTAVCAGENVSTSVTNVPANKSIKIKPPVTGWGNGALCNITIKKASLWANDNENMKDDYIYTFSTITTSGVAVHRLALRADKYSVKSNGIDKAVLTVSAIAANGATIPGISIDLSTDRGEINTSKIVTDLDGKASFTFNSDTTGANGVATVTVKSGVVTPVSLPMTITGTTLVMTPSKTVTKTGLPDDITLTGTLLDADNKPIVLSDVIITSSLGNMLKDSSNESTGSPLTVKTDGSGHFVLTYSATVVGSDTVTASALGATGTASLTVTNASFAFTSPAQNAVVNCNDPQSLSVHWTDELGVAVVGQPVIFSATNGAFGGLKTGSVMTNADGDAIIIYTASGIASPDEITATAGTLQTNLNLDIRANNPTQLNVQATSSVIGIKSEGNTPTSTIIATVRDVNDNPVAGKLVSFSLVTGAGGGEYLSPPTGVTDSSGQARTTLFAGTAASLQGGVRVRASIDNPVLTDTVNLTISGSAASIVFGTTNKIGTITVDGYPVAYELPITVLVTDINGTPVADKAVSIGIYPSKFSTGVAFLDLESKQWVWLKTALFANEDLNANAILDSGEDGAVGVCLESFYGTCTLGSDPIYYHDGGEGIETIMLSDKDPDFLNGRLDPRNVASVPMEVITDANGLAVVKVVYPKSYCNWVETKLSATTQVSGSETKAQYNVSLQCAANDIPYSSSPFGY